jgi:hypothetical protein
MIQQQHFVTEQLNERQALLSGRMTIALVASMPQSQLHVVTGRIQPSPIFGAKGCCKSNGQDGCFTAKL